MKESLRIVFMGTPDFAVPPLQALIDGPDEVVAVITNPDRPKGRGRKGATPPPVKVAAEKAGILVHQPTSVRKRAFREWMADLKPDLAVVVAYGKILPQRVLDIPTLGCVNVHASVLPELRGAAPINWAIVRGYKEMGVSIMQMEKGLDSGPVFHIAKLDVLPGETAGELHDRLSPLGAEALMTVMDGLRNGTAKAELQDHDKMTYAPMMQKSDGAIDWSQPARDIVNRILGFNPWPGAFTVVGEGAGSRFDGLRIKIHRAEVFEGPLPEGVEDIPEPGTVLSQGAELGRLLIRAGEGFVCATQCQAPGKKALAGSEFLRGCPLPRGARLGS